MKNPPYWQVLVQQTGVVLGLFALTMIAFALVAACFGGGAWAMLHLYPHLR